MLNPSSIAEQYRHGSLLQDIQAGLGKLGKSADAINIEDLAPVDEFHIGGRAATTHLLSQLPFEPRHRVLDIGCGLGGAARYLVGKLGLHVTGIDLTPEYIDTASSLNKLLGLTESIQLQQGSALSMPFADQCFDGAYMMHVGMNIESKAELFTEVRRVLRPGASFGIYDVMQLNGGALRFPQPWAENKGSSKLSTPMQYRYALRKAGFEVHTENRRRDFALEYFKSQRQAETDRDQASPLGPHTLMKDAVAVKISNLIESIRAGFISPVEMIACRR